MYGFVGDRVHPESTAQLQGLLSFSLFTQNANNLWSLANLNSANCTSALSPYVYGVWLNLFTQCGNGVSWE